MADQAAFLEEFCELLELEKGTLHGNEELAGLDSWNSLAVLGVIAYADEHGGVTLSPERILQCRTVSELAALATGSRDA